MSSNAALSAARRRRSNPSAAVPSTSSMQSHVQPVNRVLQRTGVPPPLMKSQPQPQPQPQFNQRMPPPQAPVQMRGPPPQQARYQQQQPQQQQRPQSPGMPPLPPPVKTAGPLYGIPVHPLLMFKTHDNKLNEHDLSIGDCFEQLKEIDERLTAVESSGGNALVDDGSGEVAGGDLADLMNDGAFISGVVDNIMTTTNFASIIENVIPLKEENEALKQQVNGLNEQVNGLNEQVNGLNEQVSGLNEQVGEWRQKMQQLEDRIHSIMTSGVASTSTAGVPENVVEKEEICIEAVNHDQDQDDEGEHEPEEE